MTIDITKITPEKLAEMNDALLVDNTHLRDTVANLRKQVAIAEQSLARLRNQVREDIAREFDGEVWAYDYREIAARIRAMKEPE